jgi:hypothetical protein
VTKIFHRNVYSIRIVMKLGMLLMLWCLILTSAYGPGVHSTCDRSECKESSWE